MSRYSSSGDAPSNGELPYIRRQSLVSTDDADTTTPLTPVPPQTSMTAKLRDAVRRARADSDTEELLSVIAENSGWTIDQVENDPESITFIEMFLLLVPRIPQLRLFPNLTVVKLIHIGLTSMEDLAELTLVEELWLSDNYIRKIEGLDKLTRLRRLYLQGNELTSLDGLPPLKHLRELWLCRNRIRKIDGQRHLYNVRKLRSLWLASNPISSLENVFRPFLSRLRELNLAGCEIYCFSQIANLAPIAPSLRKLWFADPLFGENPICRLSNYTTFTVQTLGAALEQLDHDEITEEQRALMAAVYDKKRLYYSMRLRSLERNCGLLCRHAQELARHKIADAAAAKRQLMECLGPVQGCVAELQSYAGKTSCAALGAIPAETIEGHERSLSRAVGTREVQIQAIARRLAEAVTSSDAMQLRLQEQLSIELHSGGNIGLHEVPAPRGAAEGDAGSGPSPSRGAAAKKPQASPPVDAASSDDSIAGQMDGYYEMAKELLDNGFGIAADAFRSKFDITGVEVNRVSRVVNRGLRTRFDDRIRELEIDMANPGNRRKMVCLFSPVAPEREEQGAYLRHTLLKGMDVPTDRKAGGPKAKKADGALGDMPVAPFMPPPANEGVPMTNSLFLADEERLLAFQRSGELTGINANANVLTGQIVISRVFLGKTVQALGGNKYSGNGSTGSSGLPFINKARRVLVKDYSPDVFSAYRTPPSLTDSSTPAVSAMVAAAAAATAGAEVDGSRVWYGLDRALILPDFVIDYTYTLHSPCGLAVPASATPALSLLTGHKTATAIRQSLFAALPTLHNAADWDDLRQSCYNLLAFVWWCQDGGTVSLLAKDETERVVAAARAELKLTDNAACSSSPVGSPASPASQPLTSDVVAAYGRRVCSEALTYCQLRGQGLTSLPKEFTAPAFASLLRLNLGDNAITSVSWFALAQAAPGLETLSLQHNRIARLDLFGTQLLQLTSLNVSDNNLGDVDEFAEAAACFPSLRSLQVEGNPLTTRVKNGAEQILAFFMDTSLATLDHVDLSGRNKQSLARWRYRRTLDLDDPKKVEELLGGVGRLTANDPTGSAGSDGPDGPQMDVWYDITSVDPTAVPARIFESVLQRLLPAEGGELVSAYAYGRQPSPRGSGGASAAISGASNLSVESLSLATAAVNSLTYNNSLSRSLSFVSRLAERLRCLMLRGHSISDLSPVLSLPLLEVLDMQDNCVAALPDLTALTALHTVNVSFNLLTSLTSMGTPPALRCLCASANAITSLDSAHIGRLDKVRELYLASNALTNISEFYPLKDNAELGTIDVSGNPLSIAGGGGGGGATGTARASGPPLSHGGDSRMYFVHLFRHLKALNGIPVTQGELLRARDAYAGKMSNDLLAERAPGPSARWSSLTSLDLSQCALKEVALLESFVGLEYLNMNRNVLVKISGLAPIKNLRVLDLSFNRLGTAVSFPVGDALKMLACLESLSLECNYIPDLNALGLQLPQLKFLNLRGNELQFLDKGLLRLPQLREIILNQNKLRGFAPDCFAACKYLTDVSADDNAIRTTDGLARVSTLERLSLGANRLAELAPLMADLHASALQEAVLVGNPLARKSNYRSMVIAYNPSLLVLDKKSISADERQRSEMVVRQSEQYAVPANIVIDMNFLESAAGQQAGGAGGGGAASLMGGAAGGLQAPGGGMAVPAPPISRNAGNQRLQPLVGKRNGYYGRGGGGGGTNAVNRGSVSRY